MHCVTANKHGDMVLEFETEAKNLQATATCDVSQFSRVELEATFKSRVTDMIFPNSSALALAK